MNYCCWFFLCRCNYDEDSEEDEDDCCLLFCLFTNISLTMQLFVISLHSVSTNNTTIRPNNSSYSIAPPERIDSGPILPNGGSFIHTFSKPGTYNYYDKLSPSMHGRINVGTSVEQGKNMNMIIGGNKSSSFNPNESQRTVLSFIPMTTSISPTIALTHQVTISNTLRPWIVFSIQ